MAVKFLEPGGDATFNVATTTGGGFWTTVGATAVTDIVHGNHLRSIRHAAGTPSFTTTPAGATDDAGTRISFYINISGLPSATSDIFGSVTPSNSYRVRITPTGVLQMWNSTVQIGTDSPALSTGVWYRISLAYTITSTTVNRFELFVNGVSAISITNGVLNNVGSTQVRIGNANVNATLEYRTSDHYTDDSSSLTDTGDIWVTAKRPFSNGTSNGFVTQIGSSGSGYGSGHTPQVNERPLSTTNGWSIAAVGATTEEYNIESITAGDMNLYSNPIVGYMGWVYTSALTSETGQLVLNGTTSSISITSTATMFTALSSSTVYPARTGTDIGMVTDATVTTVSLFECGIIVAFIGPPAPVPNDMLVMFR